MTYLKNTNKKTLRTANMTEYNAWWNMLERCNKPTNANFKNYGGRGITVCAEWLHDFDQFVTDVGPRPPNHTLERIDNEKGYSKENCKWATPAEQVRNRRTATMLTVNGVTMNQIDWANKMGISYQLIRTRIARHGWSVEDAVLTPANILYRHNCKDPALKAEKGPIGQGQRRTRRWYRKPCPEIINIPEE